ncbi:MAG TPA: hypothetical protein VHA52_08760 [Candidatus Babeliaceae bacterium]|nr:hypothetical protein [Candidatus Babeliaceae bacterium]
MKDAMVKKMFIGLLGLLFVLLVPYGNLRSYTEQEKAQLQAWGFTDDEISRLKLDNIRNPLKSTFISTMFDHIQGNPLGKYRGKSKKDIGFRILGATFIQDANAQLNPLHGPAPQDDLLLITPTLMQLRSNPNIPLEFSPSFLVINKYNLPYSSHYAPLIFRLSIPDMPKAFAQLLQYPAVNVNVREPEELELVRSPESNADQELYKKTRKPQTVLHFIIRQILRDSEHRQDWLNSLDILLQRPDVDLNAKLEFLNPGGSPKDPKEEKTAWDLASGDTVILEKLDKAADFQKEQKAKQQAEEERKHQEQVQKLASLPQASTSIVPPVRLPEASISSQTVISSTTSGQGAIIPTAIAITSNQPKEVSLKEQPEDSFKPKWKIELPKNFIDRKLPYPVFTLDSTEQDSSTLLGQINRLLIIPLSYLLYQYYQLINHKSDQDKTLEPQDNQTLIEYETLSNNSSDNIHNKEEKQV